MPKFEVTFQSVIEVKRVYEDCDNEDYARNMAQMDAEDGQIGRFHERHAVSGDVISCKQI